MISSLIQLFDSMAALNTAATLNLNDHTGEIVKTLRLWSSIHQLRVDTRTLSDGERAWDCVTVEGEAGWLVTVHDSTSERAVDRSSDIVGEETVWSPSQHTMDGAA
jgi:hypothetical protein